MATVNYDYSFTPNTAAKATEVNGNFNKIKEFAEGISTGVNLDAGVVSTAKIADGAVSTAKLANDAVTTSKILNANVTVDKLAASIPRGAVARATRNTSTAAGAAVNCFDTALTFTPVVGRLYRVTFSGFVEYGITDFLTIKNVAFVDGANNAIQMLYSETLSPIFGGTAVSATVSLADSYLIAASSTTPISINVRAWRDSGADNLWFNGSSTRQNYLLVEDIGAA